jgi:hypothetical protein
MTARRLVMPTLCRSMIVDDYLRFPVNGAQGRLRKYGNEEFRSSASDMNVKRPAAMPAGLFVV